MTADGLPLNVSARTEDPSMADPPLLRAIAAEPIVTALAENAFERRNRTCRPPTDVRTIIRTVWLLIDGRFGGIGNRRPGNCVTGAGGGAGVDAAAEGGVSARPRPAPSPVPRTSVCEVAQVATQCSAAAWACAA